MRGCPRASSRCAPDPDACPRAPRRRACREVGVAEAGTRFRAGGRRAAESRGRRPRASSYSPLLSSAGRGRGPEKRCPEGCFLPEALSEALPCASVSALRVASCVGLCARFRHPVGTSLTGPGTGQRGIAGPRRESGSVTRVPGLWSAVVFAHRSTQVRFRPFCRANGPRDVEHGYFVHALESHSLRWKIPPERATIPSQRLGHAHWVFLTHRLDSTCGGF